MARFIRKGSGIRRQAHPDPSKTQTLNPKSRYLL